MGDPFSAAASALSVVSLGVQVCQGLLIYYDDFKSFDDTVVSLCQKVAGLLKTLDICEKLLNSPEGTISSAHTNALESIDASRDRLDTLKGALDACQKHPKPQGLRANFHHRRQQVVFPFRKSHLQKLESTASALQNNVQAALQTLQIQGQIDQSKVLSNISADTRIISRQVIQDSRDTRSELSVIQQQSREYFIDIKAALSAQASFFEQVQSMRDSRLHAHLDDLTRQLQSQSLTDSSASDTFDTLALRVREQAIQQSLAQKPSLLNTMSNQIKAAESELPVISNRTNSIPDHVGRQEWTRLASRRHQIDTHAYSITQHGSLGTSSWIASLATEKKIRRNRSHPRYTQHVASWSVSLRLGYCSRILAGAIQASFSCTKGAGGMSISPSLSFRGLVTSDSPAFSLIDSLQQHIEFPADKWVSHVEIQLQALRRIFDERRASPYDIDIQGNTLIHKAFKILEIDYGQLVDVVTPAIEILIVGLLKIGVPLNDVNHTGRTAFDCLVEKASVRHFSSEWMDLPRRMMHIVDMDAHLCTITIPQRGHVMNFGPLMASLPSIAEVTDCHDISLAVVKQSESDLQQALSISPQDVDARNKFGQTALHLSMDWPRGMTILLKAGADTECVDQAGLVPLHYAVKRLLVDPIRKLGKAKCSFRQKERMSAYETSQEETKKGLIIEPVDHQWGFLWEPGKRFNEEEKPVVLVFDTLLGLLVSRRKELCELARQRIPLSEITRWLPHSSDGTHVIDETASRLAFEMESRGIYIPPHLHPGKDQITGYHFFAGYPKIAERLWKAGFRDLNGKDSLGRTPLMVRALDEGFSQWVELSKEHCFFIQWLEFVTWMLGKGADLYARQDVTFIEGQYGTNVSQDWQLMGASTIYFLAWKLGVAFALQQQAPNLQLSKRTRTEPFPILLGETPTEGTRQTLRRIVMDCTTDDCTCSCSDSGCTAKLVIDRSYTSLKWKENLYKLTSDYGNTFMRLAQLTDADAPLGISEALRLLTFQELGLKHTCCSRLFVDGRCDLAMFFRIRDQAEINEFQEEDSAGLEQLEELLIEFELKMEELAISFPDFLIEHWEARMQQVLCGSEGSSNTEDLGELDE